MDFCFATLTSRCRFDLFVNYRYPSAYFFRLVLPFYNEIALKSHMLSTHHRQCLELIRCRTASAECGDSCSLSSLLLSALSFGTKEFSTPSKATRRSASTRGTKRAMAIAICHVDGSCAHIKR